MNDRNIRVQIRALRHLAPIPMIPWARTLLQAIPLAIRDALAPSLTENAVNLAVKRGFEPEYFADVVQSQILLEATSNVTPADPAEAVGHYALCRILRFIVEGQNP